ncbi:hypothetical protein Rhopal_002647-T1 [Rhodotorula paludigena]|uniref:Uncharacterized protein n=1 Tax=Rhodotorula paludigena TaxID=86838 RepID=A0AAV5GAT2_9BASI|nr:hypothetical protein Rhopal_002647-T1 [Rhodotorula paludigena]
MAAPHGDFPHHPQADAAPIGDFARMLQLYEALQRATRERYEAQGAQFVGERREELARGVFKESGVILRPDGNHSVVSSFLDMNAVRAGLALDAQLAAARGEARAGAPQDPPAQPQAHPPAAAAAAAAAESEPKKPAPLKRARRNEAAELGLAQADNPDDFGRGKRRRACAKEVKREQE